MITDYPNPRRKFLKQSSAAATTLVLGQSFARNSHAASGSPKIELQPKTGKITVSGIRYMLKPKR